MAKVKNAIDKIRIIIQDTGARKYSDYELINYLNDACDTVAMELITDRDDTMIRVQVFKQGDTLPDDFVEFVGQMPFRLEGGVVQLDYEPQVEARYWAKFPLLKTTDDVLPYMPIYASTIAKLTGLYAMSRDTGKMDAEAIASVQADITYIRKRLRTLEPTETV